MAKSNLFGRISLNRLCWIFAAALFFTKSSLYSDKPEGFKILADKSGLAKNVFEKNEKPFVCSDWRPSEKDKKRGFAVNPIDCGINISPDWLWKESFEKTQIKLFGCPGEYRNFALAVKSIMDIEISLPEISALEKDGKKIASENLEIRTVVYENSLKFRGHFLEKDFPSKLPEGNTLWLWGTVFIPENSEPGEYKGKITIKSENGKRKDLEMRLSVLDFKLKSDSGSWGMFLPGHFSRKTKGTYRNFAPQDWSQKHIEQYFQFWKTLKLNSPIFFHVYPDLKCVDEQAEAQFPTLETFSDAMKKSQLKGFMCIDTRHMEWWANAAALKLEKLKSENKETKGDLGVYGFNGCYAKGAFPEKAISLYREIILSLIKTAKDKNWPEILIIPEEEVANGGKVKPLGYETFAPVLKKIAPEKVVIIDDGIGHNRKNAVDLGARDQLKYRQYNSWTNEALKKAEEDKASIWSYNFGIRRASFGFLQIRLGSCGFHQWADQWRNYVYSIPVSDGIISSVEYERVRAGRNDFEYFTTLKSYIEKLKSKGFDKEAENALNALKKIIADIPVKNKAFSGWAAAEKDSDLDARQAEIAMLINNARKKLGEKTFDFSAKTKGSPFIAGTAPNRIKRNKNKLLVHAPVLKASLNMDGALEDICWKSSGNETGALRWMLRKEIAMRARAASEEEFLKMQKPSYGCAKFAYDKNGLFIGILCNHATPENSNCKHGDDDAELWRDDCMEFFFMPQNMTSYYQLIVNAKGNKVLKNAGKLIKTSKMKTVSKSPMNNSGGYSQEIFIPWELLGQKEMPAPGTSWFLNVGREYHSWGQYTSWGRVFNSFAEKERWGLINFTGVSGNVKINLSNFSRYPGKNQLKGILEFDEAQKAEKLQLRLLDSDKKIIASKKINISKSQKQTSFSFDFSIPKLEKPEIWALEVINENNEELGELNLPLPAFEKSVVIKEMPQRAICGKRIELQCLFCIGNMESGKKLEGAFVSDKGETIKIKDFPIEKTGYNYVWIDTKGLSAGNWQLCLWISGNGSLQDSESCPVKILPALW
jgi:hypothetical protein